MNNTKPSDVAELEERRASAKGNPAPSPEAGTQRPAESEDGRARIRAAARKERTMRFNNLLHHLTVPLLQQAYEGLQKKAAPEVDGVDWYRYGEHLLANLTDLHERIHKGRYRARPVKREWIDKPAGGQRPLGITCVEDKIVQQALVRILESIYEQDFLGFSYGFRPGRSQHQALDALYMALTVKKVSFVLDADIQGYYDHIDQTWLMRFLEHRMADRRILKLIEQTVQAGTVEAGHWQRSEQGIPQGAVISPLRSNIFLHDALDLWARQWRGRHARGEVYYIRFADDLVACFQYQAVFPGGALRKSTMHTSEGSCRVRNFSALGHSRRPRRGTWSGVPNWGGSPSESYWNSCRKINNLHLEFALDGALL